jgi:hypothetical protein
LEWPAHAGTNTAGAVVYLLLGATRPFDFIDDEGVTISLNCENGDLMSMHGDLSSSSPCDVRSLPVGPNELRGISAISYILRFEWSSSHTCSSAGTDLTSLSAFPKSVPDFVEYGVIGVDVEVKQSTISDAGLGLFLLHDYPMGGIVTEYEGPLHYLAKVTGKRDESTLHECSHYRSVPDTDFVIVGISQGRGLLSGRGGASFANHKRASEANCKFETIWTKSAGRPRFCEDDGCYHTVPRIVLTLLKPGVSGQELFVDYGVQTAIRFLKQSSSSPPVSTNTAAHFTERHFYSDAMDVEVPSLPDGSLEPLNVVRLGEHSMTVCDERNEGSTQRVSCGLLMKIFFVYVVLADTFTCRDKYS